jgi:hypothetical protein
MVADNSSDAERPVVALVRCSSYDTKEVDRAVDRGIELRVPFLGRAIHRV